LSIQRYYNDMCEKAQIPQSGLTTITNMLPGPVSSYSEATTDISAYPPLPSDPLTPAPSTKPAGIATTTAHSLSPSGTAPTPQSSLSSPSHHPDHTIKIEEKGAWIHDNWKYMVIVGTLILVAFCIVLGLAIFYRKRKRSGKKTSTGVPYLFRTSAELVHNLAKALCR
jgi:cytochrome bd-type quinol oxidase subunit 1